MPYSIEPPIEKEKVRVFNSLTWTKEVEEGINIPKKVINTLIAPYNKISDEALFQRVRLVNILLILAALANFLLFLVRLFFRILTNDNLLITELFLPLFWVGTFFLLLVMTKTRYYYIIMSLIALVLLLNPWLALNEFSNDPNASNVLLEPTYSSILVIVFSGLLFSKQQVISFSVVSYINVILFYAIALNYPINWLFPKITMLIGVTILTIFILKFKDDSINKIKENETKFRTVSELLPVGIIIVQNNQIVYANDVLSHISGYSKLDII
ncbi:MAG: hypothetical protein ACFFAE_19665, partial [Candidatus Hodarchaeota archaeon]